MSAEHDKADEILQECCDLLDVVANMVSENRFEPKKAILENVAMSIAHILHAKKQIADSVDQ